jgi:hypothetical protein
LLHYVGAEVRLRWERPDVNRRGFLLTTAGASLAMPLWPDMGTAAEPVLGEATLAEVHRQLKRMLKQQPTGDDWRVAGSAIKMFGAHASDQRLDAKLQTAVKRALRTYGRDGLIAMRPNDAELRNLAGHAPFPGVRALDADAKGKALNELTRGFNVSQALRTLGDMCEFTGDRLTGIQPAQWPYPYVYPHMTRAQSCMWIGTMSWIVETITIVVCLLPGGQGACIPFSVVYILVNTINYFGC